MFNVLNGKNPEIVLNIEGRKYNVSSDNLISDFNLPEEVLQLILEINEGKRLVSLTSKSLNLSELIKDDEHKQINKTVIVIDPNKYQEEHREKKDSIYGIELGAITRNEIIKAMKDFNDLSVGENRKDLKYKDAGVSFHFSGNDILSEINIFNPEWQTLKGLKIGDSLNKAIELYGQPRMKSPKWSMWENLSVFIEDGLIKSIRLQK